jgi:hypothetical protein
MEKIQIVALSAGTVQGCILETRGAQNATSSAMKSVQVQSTAKYLFALSATLNKCYACLS